MMTKLLIIVAFFMAFAAGMVTGWQRYAASPSLPDPTNFSIGPTTSPTTRPRPLPGFVVQQLKLNDEQRKAMKETWDKVANLARQQGETRAALRQTRDSDIVALVKEEAADQYQEILQQYTDQSQSMEQQFQNEYDNAVAQSRELLKTNQTQLDQFERILKNNSWDRSQWSDRNMRGSRGQGGGRGGPNGRGPRGDNRGDNNRDSRVRTERDGQGATTRPDAQ